jgi:MFS family permease
MTQLSWIGSLWLALANIVGPFYSWFAVKVGYKWMLVTALFLCTLAMMFASIATEVKMAGDEKRDFLAQNKCYYRFGTCI